MQPRLKRFIWPLVVSALAAGLWFGRVHRDLPDFEVYRTAAARALDAEPLYRPDDGHWQFKYLPAFAVVLAPFALMDAALARPLWFALSVVFLWVFVRQCVRLVPQRRLSQPALAWLAVLFVGRFYVQELDLGQTNILLGVVLLAALAAIERNRPGTAGALAAAAVFVKPYALILLPWLPVAAGRAALAPAGVVLAAGLLLPIAMYGWQGNAALLAEWLRTVTETTAPNLTFPENISLAAMWTKWLGSSPLVPALTLASGLALLAGTALVVAARRRSESPAYLEFGLLMLLVPLLSPQGWAYVLLVATPAVLCLVNAFPVLPAPARLLTGVALVVTGFTIFDLLGRWLYLEAMALSVLSVSTLALGAALADLRRRRLA